MANKTVYQCQCLNCIQSEGHPDKILHHQTNLLLSRLNEQQRRWYVALEARKLGRGGIKQMNEITGLSIPTIRRGQRELNEELANCPKDRVRHPGGGRKPVEKKRPDIETVLKEEVDEEIAGDPMSNKKWVGRSLRKLSTALPERGYQVGKTTVRRLLNKMGYRLLANRKNLSGAPHPDRDKQFRYIARVKKLFLSTGYPVISVDAKKKELVGNFKNQGQTWRIKPNQVNLHDFPGDALGRAVPYGIYDLVHNQGYVYVGTSCDTPEFAAYAIAQWWDDPNRPRFEREDKLLILCDAGGSNSCRYWSWKLQVQNQLADQFNLDVMICHYPTGASKWNPVEHRLFSQISLNWAGKPLRTFDTIIGYISNTTTQTGLTVNAFLVDRDFQKGIKVSKQERLSLNLVRRPICPNWNYILKPRPLPR